MKKNDGATLRSAVLGLIYLLNSISLYIPPIYKVVFDYYNYIAAPLLVVAVFSVFRFKFNWKALLMSCLCFMFAFFATQISHFPIGDFFPLVWFIALFYCFRQLESRELRSPLFHCVNAVSWCYLIVYSVIYYHVLVRAIHHEVSIVAFSTVNSNIVGMGIAQHAFLLGVTGGDSRDKSKAKEFLIYALSLVGIYMAYARTALVFFAVMLLMKALI